MPQYYLDSPNFATATAVYANATLTVLAPDGYYSSHGIVRSQVGGQLSAYAECESCKEYQKPVEGELLLDAYPDAAAAYSLNQLNTSYSGAAIRVRRASDSTEQDIGFVDNELDTSALLAFVESNQYTSDFSIDADGLTSSGGTLTGNVDAFGLNDVLQLTVNNATSAKFINLPSIVVGKKYRVTFDLYIPSSNVVITGVRLGSPNWANIVGASITTTDQWIAVTRYLTASSTELRIFLEPLSIVGNGTDSIYLKNIIISEVTDGFVTKWYDQSGNGADATQTATTKQAKIYDSSTGVLTDNGKPAMQFDGVDDGFALSSLIAVASQKYTFTVHAVDSSDTQWSIFYETDTTDVVPLAQAGSSSAIAFAYTLNALYQDGGAAFSGTRDDLYNAYTSAGQSLTTIDFSGDGIGGFFNRASFVYAGTAQEIIVYPSDQSSNRAGIESNINSRYQIYWDGSVTSLLDTYPNAAAGYSLRALNSSYTGPIVRVRRASDNAETDVYALYNGELNTSAIESFCTGTDGFVTKWYDQSGGANDATQATTANQPKIYDSVTGVVTENGKVALDFDGSNDYLDYTGLTETTLTSFHVAKPDQTNSGDALIGWDGTTGSAFFRYNSDGTMRANFNGGFNTTTNYLAAQNLVFAQFGTSLAIGYNGATAETGSAIGLTTTGIRIGQKGNVDYFKGKAQEIIVYPSDQSANRAGIESNINDYFNIY